MVIYKSDGIFFDEVDNFKKCFEEPANEAEDGDLQISSDCGNLGRNKKNLQNMTFKQLVDN